MGQDPGTIREQIEETRGRMGDTVDALAYKADVKSRAKESVTDRIDTFRSKITGAADSVSEATPSTGDIKQSARQAAGVAQENPLGLAIGAVAAGFLAGMLVPATRVENQRIGPIADTVKEQARETAQVAVEHGKQAAQDAAQQATSAAADAVKDAGQQHAEQAKDDLQQQAEQAREQVASAT